MCTALARQGAPQADEILGATRATMQGQPRRARRVVLVLVVLVRRVPDRR